jgi:FkbM family methyltransferase
MPQHGIFWRRKLQDLISPQVKAGLKEWLRVPDLEVSLRRLARVGFRPRAVVDIGANVGDWSRMCRRVFPQTRLLDIEPQPAVQPALRSTADELGDVTVVTALVGAQRMAGVPFHLHHTVSSVLRENGGPPVPTIALDMVTLDDVIAEAHFPAPEFIKLDVQGYELEVLTGAPRALGAAEVVLAEVSLLPIYEGAPLLHEVVAFMHEHEFQAYDICSVMRRPLDDALFQTDMIFVRRSSSLVASLHWA